MINEEAVQNVAKWLVMWLERVDRRMSDQEEEVEGWKKKCSTIIALGREKKVLKGEIKRLEDVVRANNRKVCEYGRRCDGRKHIICPVVSPEKCSTRKAWDEVDGENPLNIHG